jgi:hypothetical protein
VPDSPFDLLACDERWRRARCHQPFFCEENVWQLLHDSDLPEPRAALFVINRHRAVAMWGQRAVATDPIVWDYHVVVLLPAHEVVVDLDDRERVARPLGDWLRHAFRSPDPRLQPWFRRVPAAEFLAVFSSDRSHMRDGAGRALQRFPPWPAPFQPERGMNLGRFLDLDDAIAGDVLDAAGLLRWGRT